MPVARCVPGSTGAECGSRGAAGVGARVGAGSRCEVRLAAVISGDLNTLTWPSARDHVAR